MSSGHQRIKWCRNIAENFNRLSRAQRRIQDLERGGSSLPLPFPFLPFPSLPFPLLSLPSLFLPLSSPPFPFLSLPRPYPFPPSPSLRSRTPWLRLGGLGERYKLPQRVRAEPGRQTLSVAFSAYLGAFWQAFSNNLSLVKLQLLTPSQFFSDFSFQKCDASAKA